MAEATMTADTEAFFRQLLADAANWSGDVMIGNGSNVRSTPEVCGYLTAIKKLGFVITIKDRGDMLVTFTDAGVAAAGRLGFAFDGCSFRPVRAGDDVCPTGWARRVGA